jgi:hypothetical protein
MGKTDTAFIQEPCCNKETRKANTALGGITAAGFRKYMTGPYS